MITKMRYLCLLVIKQLVPGNLQLSCYDNINVKNCLKIPCFTGSLYSEMFKMSKGLSPKITHISPVRIVFKGTFVGPKIWELVPGEMKKLENLW